MGGDAKSRLPRRGEGPPEFLGRIRLLAIVETEADDAQIAEAPHPFDQRIRRLGRILTVDGGDWQGGGAEFGGGIGNTGEDRARPLAIGEAMCRAGRVSEQLAVAQAFSDGICKVLIGDAMQIGRHQWDALFDGAQHADRTKRRAIGAVKGEDLLGADPAFRPSGELQEGLAAHRAEQMHMPIELREFAEKPVARGHGPCWTQTHAHGNAVPC
jgi:hypothetical protein